MPENKIRRSVPIKENDTDATDKPEVLDYAARHQELFEQYQNGELTAEEYKDMVNVLFESAGDEKGTIPKGETVTGKENFDNPVPLSVNDEGNTQRFVRTVLEGGQLTEEMVHTVKQQILSGAFTYEPTSNEKNFDFAKQAIAKNAAEGIWEKAVNSSGLPNKNEIAIGEALLKQAVENNDAVNVIKYTAELADMGTRLGQSVQALSLLKRMDGVGQLVYVKRAVDTLNNDLQKRFKSKAPVVEIDENSQVSKRGNKRTCKNGFQCWQNKIRTNKWLTENGLQLPKPSSIVGSINSITNKAPTVNSNSKQGKGCYAHTYYFKILRTS